jgi:uncharacterized protein YcbK (DUF882 family)
MDELSRSGRARRRLLRFGLAGATMCALAPVPVLANLDRVPRVAALHHLHTGERVVLTYYANGRYEPGALAEIDHLLRDFRTGEVHPISPALLDWLHALRTDSGVHAPYEVICGYRSPRTNAALRGAGHGVAVRSLHLQGMAIDVRLPGRSVGQLRQAAWAAPRGGVGYYPDDGFVHLDVGRVRRW